LGRCGWPAEGGGREEDTGEVAGLLLIYDCELERECVSPWGLTAATGAGVFMV
jgi:hypothetical protein